MNRKQRRASKKQLEIVKAILGTMDVFEAEKVLEFAIEVKRKYGNSLSDTIGVIADLKEGCPDHSIDWLVDQVRTGLEERTATKHRGTIEALRMAGISQPVAESLAVEVERLEAEFGISAPKAVHMILAAVNGGQRMTAQDLREIALQLDEDKE